MKRIILLLLSVCMILCSVSVAFAQENEITVKLDGRNLEFDQPPVIINSRTMVPLRAIFEAMGMQVEWDPVLYEVTATNDDTTIKMTVGEDKAYVNGEEKTLDSAPVIVNSRTLVPVRFISESAGAGVEWDGENRVVTITSSGNKFDKYIYYRDSLQNTYTKLTQDKSLRILYYGGSVTAGTGATNESVYPWRAQTTKWFKESFPEAKIVEINKTVAESGTLLGSYRLQNDVIAEDPDLMFIEYAINDTYGSFSKDTAKRQFETIVRDTRRAHPDCDIVCIISIDSTRASREDFFYPTAQGHAEICEAYDIPLVYVGRALTDTIDPSEYNTTSEIWSKYFTDIVHPTNEGYAFYFDVIKEYLTNALLESEFTAEVVDHTLPAVQSEYLLDGARTVEYATKDLLRDNDGWTFSLENLHTGFYKNGTIKAEITEDMAPFTYTFEGTELLLYTNLSSSEMFECTIDGETTVKRPFGSTTNPKLIISGLEPGVHTVQVKPIASTVKSTTHMYIAAVFTRDASKQSVKGDQ